VGDSRGYILRDGKLIQLTRDQSLVNQLIEAGQLTEEEAETFEHNNIILQALGTADTVQVDLTYCELRRGDVLLLCSDGLSGMVRAEEIREALRSADEPVDACKLLTDRANQAGGHDNITVVVARFDGEGLKPLTPENEPLKYRKYTLPEEPVESTEPGRNVELPASLQPRSVSHGSSAPQGLTSTMVGGPMVIPARPAAGHPHAPAGYEEEQVDIPGTHVPPWVVVVLVVGVILVLAGTAILFLR
jgi:protein phosphatase